MIAAALLLATAWALSPWRVAVIAGLVVAGVAAARMPRQVWVADVGVAVAVGSGVGWAIDSAATARRATADLEQTRAFNRRSCCPATPATPSAR